MKPLTVGSLFAGIGGFDSGFTRAGFQISWQCELDPFCRAVLEKHWPGVTRYPDVRELRHPPAVDVLCGGFPCQDISAAGKRVGIDGERSGLWFHYARVIGELRPRYVVVENVADLLIRGMGRVLGDLAALGYDAEWSVVSACAVGAPHTRERVFIVAYPASECRRRERWRFICPTNSPEKWDLHQWQTESMPFRVADGVPARVHRLRALGNSIVPQIAEWIANRIKEAEGLP